MTGEILRAHIQRKWNDGCYDKAPQSRVGQIVSAIRQYARVAKQAGAGDRFTDPTLDLSFRCNKTCRMSLCDGRRACVGRDQSVYTRNELLGLIDGGRHRRDTEQCDKYQAVLDDLQSLGK